MKLSNLASLDPVQKLRNIKGLEGASNLDREMWEAFHAQPEELVPASEDALRALILRMSLIGFIISGALAVMVYLECR